MKNFKNSEEFRKELVDALKTDKDIYIYDFCMDDDVDYQRSDDTNCYEFYTNALTDFNVIQDHIMYLVESEEIPSDVIAEIEAFRDDDLTIRRMYIFHLK